MQKVRVFSGKNTERWGLALHLLSRARRPRASPSEGGEIHRCCRALKVRCWVEDERSHFTPVCWSISQFSHPTFGGTSIELAKIGTCVDATTDPLFDCTAQPQAGRAAPPPAYCLHRAGRVRRRGSDTGGRKRRRFLQGCRSPIVSRGQQVSQSSKLKNRSYARLLARAHPG